MIIFRKKLASEKWEKHGLQFASSFHCIRVTESQRHFLCFTSVKQTSVMLDNYVKVRSKWIWAVGCHGDSKSDTTTLSLVVAQCQSNSPTSLCNPMTFFPVLVQQNTQNAIALKRCKNGVRLRRLDPYMHSATWHPPTTSQQNEPLFSLWLVPPEKQTPVSFCSSLTLFEIWNSRASHRIWTQKENIFI